MNNFILCSLSVLPILMNMMSRERLKEKSLNLEKMFTWTRFVQSKVTLTSQNHVCGYNSRVNVLILTDFHKNVKRDKLI